MSDTFGESLRSVAQNAVIVVLGNIGAKRVEVAIPPSLKDMKLSTWIDPEDFNPGYIMRGMHLLPKKGDKPEWQHTQDYWVEKDELPKIDLDDAAFVYK